MKLIEPQSIALTAAITEDELRERMAMEVLEQIGGLDAGGKPLLGIDWKVTRGDFPKGGYVINVTWPAPTRISLPREGNKHG